MSEFELPTIEECRAFHEKINEGRELCGLGRLDVLEFDEAIPGHGDCCLSATNLFADAGYSVGFEKAWPEGEANPAMEAMLSDVFEGVGLLPPEIKAVTDRFDALGGPADEDYLERRAALRRRLVEAGVVAPKVGAA